MPKMGATYTLPHLFMAATYTFTHLSICILHRWPNDLTISILLQLKRKNVGRGT